MKYEVVNNDPTDKVNYRKVVQVISQSQLNKWRLDSALGLDVPIGMYIITPIVAKPRRKMSWNGWHEKHEFDIQCD